MYHHLLLLCTEMCRLYAADSRLPFTAIRRRTHHQSCRQLTRKSTACRKGLPILLKPVKASPAAISQTAPALVNVHGHDCLAQRDFAGVGLFLAHQHPEEGGLARTIAADDACIQTTIRWTGRLQGVTALAIGSPVAVL